VDDPMTMKPLLPRKAALLRHLAALGGIVAGTLAVCCLFNTPAAAQAATSVPPPPLVGVWIDHTGRGAIEIAQCGQALCGRIVWTKDTVDARGQPLRDMLNPDKAKRGQPICGLQIIGDVKAQRNGTWDEGWIYDPEKGEEYSVELALRQPDVLQVKGYLGVKFLSETFTWRRAPPNQQRCNPS
jgi:uncharacterized protein (DUF2147 family)